MATHPAVRQAAVGRVAGMLRSIQHPGGRVTVHYRNEDLEISLVEIAGHNSLVDPSLAGRASWHLVLDGQAIFHVGASRWELLPDESLTLDTATPYTIVNPSPARLRVLSVVSAPSGVEQEGQR